MVYSRGIKELAGDDLAGREALVEVLGFWRKETLQARIELLASAGPKNLVLAVPWKLRGGAEDEATAAGAKALFVTDQPAHSMETPPRLR